MLIAHADVAKLLAAPMPILTGQKEPRGSRHRRKGLLPAKHLARTEWSRRFVAARHDEEIAARSDGSVATVNDRISGEGDQAQGIIGARSCAVVEGCEGLTAYYRRQASDAG